VRPLRLHGAGGAGSLQRHRRGGGFAVGAASGGLRGGARARGGALSAAQSPAVAGRHADAEPLSAARGGRARRGAGHSAGRNRAIARIYRRHRNWHVVTLAAALEWLRAKSFRVYVVRGEALAPTHEVNRAKPVSPTIVALHNRTVENVARQLGLALHEATRDDEQVLLNAAVM